MIESPILYMGSKKKLINQGLINLFPNSINTFYDLFGGSGIVSMNTKADNYVLNDIDSKLFEFYALFKKYESADIIYKILENIKKFDMKRVGTKQNTYGAEKAKDNYCKLRDYANSTKSIVDLYTCTFYAFSQQMRFNSKGEFNMPFGNGAFSKTNEYYIAYGCKFFSGNNVSITNKSFKDINVDKLESNDFVYLDPPYFNSTATYNENGGWTKDNEEELYNFCETLDKKGIKWAMSNAFTTRGNANGSLVEWSKKNDYSVYHFNDFDYTPMGKSASNVDEVLISNYKPQYDEQISLFDF